MTRGVAKLKVMDQDWEQTGLGMAEFVKGLPALLDGMLGDGVKKPRVCFTDKSPGLYNNLTGEIVGAYSEALRRYGFRSFAGSDGKWQPADLCDFFLHETVVAWVRKYFAKRPVSAKHGVEANLHIFVEKMRECEEHINENYADGFQSLCRGANKRLEKLVEEQSARIWH